MSKFSEDQLKEFAGFLVYEMTSYQKALDRYRQADDESFENRWAGMAAHVNYRCFLDFFFRQKGSNDDVLAVDYLTNWNTTGWKHLDEHGRCNKMIAHLSMSRPQMILDGRGDSKLFAMREISKYWRLFLHQLPPERRAWFD